MQTITLPPVIQPQLIDAGLVAPCGDTVPDKATPKAVGVVLPQIVWERDCANWKLERIRSEVKTK